MAMVCLRTCSPLRVKLLHGAIPRSRPHSSFLWSPSYPCRCFSVLRQQAPLPIGKTSRRHHSSRRTHYVLLSDRHLPASERRSFSPGLALLPLAPLVDDGGSLATSCKSSRAVSGHSPWYIVSPYGIIGVPRFFAAKEDSRETCSFGLACHSRFFLSCGGSITRGKAASSATSAPTGTGQSLGERSRFTPRRREVHRQYSRGALRRDFRPRWRARLGSLPLFVLASGTPHLRHQEPGWILSCPSHERRRLRQGGRQLLRATCFL